MSNYMYKKFLIIFFIISIITQIFANPIMEDKILIFAVTSNHEGTSAELHLKLIPGNGNVWSKVSSLIGTSTQETEKTILELAKKYSKEVNKYDYLFEIKSSAKMVEGPSAGLPMALLLISMLKGKNLPSYVSGTGAITKDGDILKIGGLVEKTKVAAKKGIKIFFVPYDELKTVVKDDKVKMVNFSKYAYEKWGIHVIGVKNIDEALNIAFKSPNELSPVDLNDINILKFTPPKSRININLLEFYNFLFSYVQDANETLAIAKETLTNTKLDDTETLNYLYEVLTNAEHFYNDANTALHNRYLYSTANYAFLSRVYSSLVIDVAKDPELLKTNSNFYEKVRTLNGNIEKLLQKIQKIPVKGFEWNIAAKERLLWSKNNINDIEEISVILDKDLRKATYLAKLEKYEFAKEWYNMAKLFISYTSYNEGILDEEYYKKTAEILKQELEKTKNVLDAYNLNDVKRRIYGAEYAYDHNWYLVSIYESASTLAIVNSTIQLDNIDENQLLKNTIELLNKLKSIETRNIIWGNLYYQHAIYFYNAYLFYKDNNLNAKAISNLKSAYQLAQLAFNLSETTKDVLQHMVIIKENYKIQQNIKKENNKVAIVLIIILTFALLSYSYYIFKIRKKDNISKITFAIDKEIDQIKHELLELNREFVSNRINEKKYKELYKKYITELDTLKKKKKKLYALLEDLELLNSEEKYITKEYKSLSKLFSKKIIDKKEYNKFKKKYNLELKNIKIKRQKITKQLLDLI